MSDQLSFNLIRVTIYGGYYAILDLIVAAGYLLMKYYQVDINGEFH
jgi:hypothetical protein